MNLAAALPLVAIACGHAVEKRQTPDPGPPRPVEVTPAAVETMDTLYVATSTIRGRNTAVITSKAMGNVKEIHVRPGDTVEAGQVLIELDARAARAQVGQARAGISEAEASVVQAEQDLEAARAEHRMAELTWSRMRTLAEKKAVTAQERDQAETAFRASAARVRVAEARLQAANARTGQARASRDVASANLGDRIVAAPFAGRVVSRNVDVGDLAAPGTPLLTLEQLGTFRAEAVVDESRASQIAVGDEARVDVEALGRELHGKVSEVVPAVDVGTRAFVAKIDLPPDGEGHALRPGMFARARFRVGSVQKLVVPVTAVSRRGPLERVFLARDNAARLRLVTVGAEQDGVVEVLSGLEEGESVIVNPPSDLFDGAPIVVMSEAAK